MRKSRRFFGFAAAALVVGACGQEQLASVAGPDLGPDTKPPTAPASLSAVAVSVSAILLRWAPASDDRGVVAYLIYRNDTQAFRVAAGSHSNCFMDLGRAPGTTYTYSVAAVDAAGNISPRSIAVSAQTPQLQEPGLLVAAIPVVPDAECQ